MTAASDEYSGEKFMYIANYRFRYWYQRDHVNHHPYPFAIDLALRYRKKTFF